MSRTAAIVITMVLGLPILAMVAIASAGGFSPSLLTTFLVGGVVMTFLVGAVFEIKRLLDGEGHYASEPSHSGHGKPVAITVVDTPAPAEAAIVPPARTNAAVPETRSTDSQTAEPQIALSAEPEPIIVAQAREADAVAVEPKGVRKTRTKRADADPTEPGPATPGAPKGKRKGARTKQATSV